MTDERSASVCSSSQLATPTRVHFDQSHPVTAPVPHPHQSCQKHQKDQVDIRLLFISAFRVSYNYSYSLLKLSQQPIRPTVTSGKSID